jgi:hypothetical protein
MENPGEGKELTEQEAKAEREKITDELWGEKKPEGEKQDLEEPEKEPGKKEELEQVDPWAGVSPTLRTHFEAIKSKADKVDLLGQELNTVSERLKQAERRVGSLTNELGQARKAAEETAKKDKDAPTKEAIDAAAKSEELWLELKADFPEWTEAMDKRLAAENARTDKRLKEIGDKIDSIKPTTEFQEEKIQELKVEFAKEFVSSRHPRWQETVKTQDFTGWIDTQPDEIKEKCRSLRPTDAIEVLDLFQNRENGGHKKPNTAAKIAEDRKTRLRESETLSHGRVRKPGKQLDDMTNEEYRQELARDIWQT